MVARCLPNSAVQRAKQLVGENNAHLALSLISYNNDVSKAMEYAFGSTIICDTMENAMKV